MFLYIYIYNKIAIFHLCSLRRFLSRSLYDIPGRAPDMGVLFWGQRDFPISFSNRDASKNAWNRHWGSFMVETGSFRTILSSNLANVNWHSVAIFNYDPPPIRHYTKSWSYNRNGPFIELWEVSIEHLRRVWHADRGHSYGHLVPLHLGGTYVLRLETNPFPKLAMIFSDYALRTLDFDFHPLSSLCWKFMRVSVPFINIITALKKSRKFDLIYFNKIRCNISLCV